MTTHNDKCEMAGTASDDKARGALCLARRIVLKIGTRVLVQKSGRPNMRRMRSLARDIAALARDGREIVFVTSGAIGAGMQALGMKQRPARLPELQMAAAVGQSRLMTRYEKLFSAEHCVIGQVLLTHDDLKNRSRHLNARNTMLTMLRNGIIPVVNENDTVAVDEIKFGDNDILASLVVHLIDADLLVMLTTSDGVRDTLHAGRSRRLSRIESITDEILLLANGKGGSLSTGGMASKLAAAREVTETGVAVVIADGRKSRILRQIIEGNDVGTFLRPALGRGLQGRKRWLAFFQKPAGTLVVDEGARRAMAERGKSLLPVGVKEVEGTFGIGAAVNIVTQDRKLVARGLASYASADIRLIMGRRTNEIAGILGGEGYEEVVHRDNMALMKTGDGNEPA